MSIPDIAPIASDQTDNQPPSWDNIDEFFYHPPSLFDLEPELIEEPAPTKTEAFHEALANRKWLSQQRSMPRYNWEGMKARQNAEAARVNAEMGREAGNKRMLNIFILGSILSSSSLAYDTWANLIYDSEHYIPTRGINAGNLTSVWKTNKTGNFVTRKGNRIPNSANAAAKLKINGMVKTGGVLLNTINMGVIVYDIRQNGLSLSNGVDFVMGGIGYIPGWGWAVSGGYFIGKACYEVYPSIPTQYWGRPGTGFSK